MSTTRSLATLAAHAGMPAVLRRLRRRAGTALALMYHRVSNEPDYLGLCVPPAQFDAQIARLRRRARVVRLTELVERLADPAPLREDLAAVTFDDGYRDNLDVALPILQRHGVPATLFLTTGFMDGSARPVGDRLLGAFELLWQHGVEPDAWPRTGVALDECVRRALAQPRELANLRQLDAALKQQAGDTTANMLDSLARLAGAGRGGPARLLDWDAVRILSRQGVEIAAHTVTHPILSRISARQAEAELRGAKTRIEAEIGQPVTGFAYPNGHATDFGSEHVELLRGLGFTYACTAERGGNRPGCDPFRLRRIGVGADSASLLDLKLALAGSGH